MPKMSRFFIFTLLFLFTFSLAIARKSYSSITDQADKSSLRTYIVHVKQPGATTLAASGDRGNWYRSFLPVRTTLSSDEEKRMIYSYKSVLSGFAARLTAEEVKAMEEKDGFISAHLDGTSSLQTTHSPGFLGLHQEFGMWKGSNFGKGVIIGVLDSGVLPSHPSFSDEGMPPPPAKWKGRCDFNVSGCNNKVIGARSFMSGAQAEPPIDEEGHGTHTASTAAGGFVKNANALGNAIGTAAGMAPYAHLAIYKVCGGPLLECADSDILAALDAAVEDGVDVLSLSIVSDEVDPFYKDIIAIGTFSAIQKGIFVSCSGGNAGPFNSTMSNEPPWILTVGASTIDRRIRAVARLGNGEEFDGESVFQPHDFPSTLLPLVYAGVNDKKESEFCGEGSLKESVDVKGKIVLCVRGGGVGRILKGKEVKSAGGVAMILMNPEADGFSTLADSHILPATDVSFSAGSKILAYINLTSTPMATIVFKGTVIGTPSSSPAVASFSSRGPSVVTPGILKPDIIGPGVSILAAWPFSVNNSTINSTSNFNIISGTSMSCPHLTGIAALLKSSHPDWSPAAIKSSIMTTADLLNLEGKPIVDETLQPADLFATGAGHVNPSRADDPGLVYDIHPDDYIPYLCGLRYTDAQVGILAHRKISCSEESSIPEAQLNYPSFSVTLGPSQTFTRRVTNVGEPNSYYTVEIIAPKGVSVSVKPKKLLFTQVKQTITYSVTFSRVMSDGAPAKEESPFAQGFLTWVSAKHFVRSPISVKFG